ncbi:ribonuclease E inhibitor RraB [Sphingomonas oryzagri]|uniref:Ribonuclease E inhibitor RraB n=1 Tax=Sphingomonas oryzagri TaxID=3042314 RepID=A0ABT6MYM9_9SPHN|nr:ribonuclease E inhibitor RraB [Sphingomonas oryzagri]MDH7637594.1 ribonuclease E inhibitor RraB [Sphingomonas oryzagri]
MKRYVACVIGCVLLGSSASAAPTSADECVGAKLPASLGVIDQMASNSLDLTKSRAITQLFLGSPKALAKLQPSLTQAGYKVSLDPAGGRLIAAKDEVVTSDWVKSVIPQMCNAAARNAVEYDGWDVDVAADHISSN